MTETTGLSAPTPAEQAMVEQARFEKAAIWLPQYAVLNFNAGKDFIRDKVFEECLIEGPGLIMALAGTTFEGCNMGLVEDHRSLLLRGVGPKVAGSVGFFNCRFIACRFLMIGFTGNEEFIENFSGNVAFKADRA